MDLRQVESPAKVTVCDELCDRRAEPERGTEQRRAANVGKFPVKTPSEFCVSFQLNKFVILVYSISQNFVKYEDMLCSM